jgi:DNA polymerase-3 subunit delta'
MDWNIFGHDWAVHLLKQHIARGDMRHAYLFCGPPGVGRRRLALRFAQAVNCQHPPAPGEVCGACRVCLAYEKGQHIDLSLVKRSPTSTELVIDQVRELQRTLSLSPYESNYRVALLQNFEDANTSAQNALLKTLEEAPARVILLLTVNMSESLLPTIVSRCEVMRLRPSGLDALGAVLQSHWQVEAEQARLLSHLSGGCVGTALRLGGLYAEPDQPDGNVMMINRQTWLQDLQGLLGASRRERFAYVQSLVDSKKKSKDKEDTNRQREELRQRLQTWLSFWRDVMLAASQAETPLINLDCEKEIYSLAEKVGMERARECVVCLEKTLNRLAFNLNNQLLLEVLMLDLPFVDC